MEPRASRLLCAAAAFAAAIAVAPGPAGAQPGGPPPPPPGGYYRGGGYYAPPPLIRQGLTLGAGLGLGGMDSESGAGDCQGCDYDPIAVGFDLHIGGMINPRLAILGEFWWHAQRLNDDGVNWLNQSMLLGAAQYWLTPQLWLKGGIGFASLSEHYDDGYYYGDEEIDTGLALMGAAGYEIASSPWFAVDLQLRLGSGSYDGVDDQINVGMVGIGFNWY